MRVTMRTVDLSSDMILQFRSYVHDFGFRESRCHFPALALFNIINQAGVELRH